MNCIDIKSQQYRNVVETIGARMDESQDHPDDPQQQPEPPPAIIQAAELFHGRREIWIEHAGVRYRLQITRRNRLILQK